MNGIDAAQQILTLLPQTRIVVLSACHTLEHVHRAMRAGLMATSSRARWQPNWLMRCTPWQSENSI